MDVMKSLAPRKDSIDSAHGLLDDADDDQIVERLGWTPRERLDYLLDMLDFEQRARRARRIPRE